MEITIQNLSKSQVELKIEVPFQEFERFIDKAISTLGQNIQVEGFRKGNAPKEAVKERVGEQSIMQAAAEACVQENYIKAIKEKNLEPLGQPAIDVLKLAPGNPFEFKATIAVLSEVILPDYKKIASQLKIKEVKVTAEEIEKLKQEKQRAEKERLRTEIVEKIAKESQLEIPNVLVESEKKRMLDTIKMQVPQMLGVSFEEYLKKLKKTEKELLDSFSPEAEKRVKNSLVLREIQKKENMAVPEKELEAEMAKIEQMSPGLDKNHLKEYAENVIKNEKTFQLLENLVQK